MQAPCAGALNNLGRLAIELSVLPSELAAAPMVASVSLGTCHYYRSRPPLLWVLMHPQKTFWLLQPRRKVGADVAMHALVLPHETDL